ncbi:MAG TPA: alpha/beta hydrolase [Burkholderiaceae bacterium]|nr:alpha/beta hydrolase [Burkholderiaceae bacterium]
MAESLSVPTNTNLVRIRTMGRDFDIEYRWAPATTAIADAAAAGIGQAAPGPVVVFLHEGLGSVSMWRDFPDRVCAALGLRGLVYSRAGYGRSTPREPGERWQPDYMHRQAREALPALLEALGVKAPYFLFGHSDGASIALIHAAAFPDRMAGLVVLAPHLFVEDISVRSIEDARRDYLETDRFRKLARHHGDVDSAFWGWNDIWLAPAFRDWNIEALLPSICCPVLAVQGRDDEFGTLAQIDGIAAALPGTRRLVLDECHHSPHRDQPEAVIAATREFFTELAACGNAQALPAATAETRRSAAAAPITTTETQETKP